MTRLSLRTRFGTGAALAGVLALLASAAGTAAAAPPPGGPPAPPALGPVPSQAPWTFGVVLPSRDPTGLAAYAQAVSQPGSALYHHFLSHAALLARFGPSPALEARVAGALAKAGLDVTPDGQVLTAEGSVAQVNALFGTTLTRFAPGPHAFVAPSGPVSLPSVLDGTVGVIGLTADTLHPLATTVRTAPADEIQTGPAPASPATGSESTGSSPSGALRVSVRLLSNRPRVPGLAVRYLVTASLDGAPDPTATFAGLSGPIQGAASFVDPSPTNQDGQFLLSFSAGQSQDLNLTLTVTDGAGHSAQVPLPTAVFQGPSVATCDGSPLFGLSGSVLCPFNPATQSINRDYGATGVAALPAQLGPATVAVYTEGETDTVIPPATEDLATFAQMFGLPSPTVTSAYSGPNACTVTTCGSAGMSGIQLELTLDMEMLETASPGANIQVYGAGSLRSALNQVITQDTVHVFSISYGAGELVEAQYEPGAQETWDLLAEEANAEGITILSAAGDSGAFEGIRDGSGVPQVNYPANSPYVTAVGGTEAAIDPAGTVDESALWGGDLGQELPTPTLLSFLSLTNMMGGGGVSLLEPTPWYQLGAGGLPRAGRATPDVSLPASGVTPGYYGIFDGAPALFGGTSAATPILAGWLADLNLAVGPLGNVNPLFYGVAAQDPGAFLPVTYGANGVDTVTPGYNAVTGLGSPDFGLWAGAVSGLSQGGGAPPAGPAFPPSGSTPVPGAPGGPGGPPTGPGPA